MLNWINGIYQINVRIIMVRYQVFCKNCNAENFIDLDDTVPLRTIDCDNKVCNTCRKIGMRYPKF